MRARQDGDALPEFDVALWGYHRGQVDRCIEDLSARLEEALGQLSAVDTLHAQLCATTLELDQLRQALPERRDWPDRIGAIMATADEQAAAQRRQALREAEEIRARAQAEARRPTHATSPAE